MQTTQFRVRLNEDNAAFVRKLAEDSGLSPIDISTTLLHAACVAMREGKGRAPFPPRFEIAEARGGESHYRLNEPRTGSRK
jgi:hypothetical protein